MKIITSLFLLFLIIPSTSCAQENKPTKRTTPLNVVATFSILGDFVKNIAGDKVRLRVLVGPDSDGHVYHPGADDARAVASADLLIANGLGFENWLSSLTHSAEFNGILLIVGDAIEPLMVVDHHNPAFKVPDPHAWQDIHNVIIYVKLITKQLSQLDAKHRGIYQQNAKAYVAQLIELDENIKLFTQALPNEKKKLVTSHDAFGYFGHAYGLTFTAPQGISTDAEAKTRDVATLIKQIRHEKIPALFVEGMLDDRLLQQISRETGVRIGGQLYSDALSAPEKGASTYLSMMKHNLMTLQHALSVNN